MLYELRGMIRAARLSTVIQNRLPDYMEASAVAKLAQQELTHYYLRHQEVGDQLETFVEQVFGIPILDTDTVHLWPELKPKRAVVHVVERVRILARPQRSDIHHPERMSVSLRGTLGGTVEGRRRYGSSPSLR